MLPRTPRALRSHNSAKIGRFPLILGSLIVYSEAIMLCFARPLLMALLFVGLAWLGVLSALYPWAHLVALAVFILLFFASLGKARQVWQAPTASHAKRRVEHASGLSHRPLDVLEDHALAADAETQTLWQMHVARAEAQVRNLRWPRWNFRLASHDPYRVRYIASALLVAGLVSGWGALGGRLIAAINPALGKMTLNGPTMDAWITPPAYTHLAPIMIATPAGSRFQGEEIVVPEGSILHAHLAERDGEAPVLDANGQSTEFSAAEDKDFEVTTPLNSGDSLSIRRGWMKLGSWKMRVVPDAAPQIAFTDAPTATERKDVRIAYDAKDDYGVTSVTLRLTPRQSMPGASNDPVEFPLASIDEKEFKRVDFKDLTAEPWAGMPVDLQLIATDAVGHTAASDKVTLTLPERVFFNPVARLLVDERKKLLQNMFDAQLRNEAANLMAGLAHQPASFGKDPLVMMALRAGAVRLVLQPEGDAVASVKDILWQTATRIEDGATGMAEQNLHQAQQELADALDRNASEKEVQTLIDRLHQALAQYLAELSTRVAAHPTKAEDLGQVLGSRSNALTPQDLGRMLQQMKGLSASGDRSAAREELAKLQQILENLRTAQPGLSKEQQATLEQIKALRALTQEQQSLMDTTFQKAQSDGYDLTPLAAKQAALLTRLKSLMATMQGGEALPHSADAMARAEKNLQQNANAVTQQDEALKALQQATQSMASQLRASMLMLPQMGRGSAQQDPFGRDGEGNPSEAQSGVHVPDHFDGEQVRAILNEIQHRAGDMARPKSERDYIERLLQNF